MQFVLIIIDCLLAVLLIGAILLQHGKGADVGASFGGGTSGGLFGPTGGATFLSRATAVLAAAFFANTLALAILAKGQLLPFDPGDEILVPGELPAEEQVQPESELLEVPLDDGS